MAGLSRRTFVISTAALAATAPMMAAYAEGGSATIEMLNKHPTDSKAKQVFYPRLLQVNAGDTVMFKSVDKGHNTATVKKMLPDGAEAWKSKINDDFEVTFEKAGFYGFQCTPHASVGMVGLIVVEGEGKLDNLESAMKIKHRGKAKKAFAEIWEEAEAAGYLNESATDSSS